MKQIIIDICSDGEVHVETKGFTGSECLESSQFVKDLLGSEVERELVPAFYMRNRELVRRHLPLCG
ncbi:conserved hypothetical protein [Desulfamplus magnetovallimortis]|uniref:DUF2997 domain-containing protein n=1 Tax=Desulfamplus magnetovallimortis TaxID=1246637 RepID=A0A1W1HEG1_9BACT|nr:DUF2997 domain-containing protein [Desulfamplus magnetovallimortis]SLM30778.1 conserved hypothetical protein [Desulfamplus magnetovallimortis]